MTFAQRFRRSNARLVRHFGDGAVATIVRRVSLLNQVTGASYSTLSVDGVTNIGAALIDLDAQNLKGELPAGITFTIDGDVTVYTTTASIEAANGKLTDVPFTPTLVAQAADDAAVTLTADVASYTVPCAIEKVREDDAANENIQTSDRMVKIDPTHLAITIREDDGITIQGRKRKIAEVFPHQPGDILSAVRLLVRGF